MEANKELMIQEILEKWLPTPEGAYETDDIINAMEEYANQWKLKYDELNAENERLTEELREKTNSAKSLRYSLDTQISKHAALKKKAQGLVDVLEMIESKLNGINDTITNDIQRIASTALQSWQEKEGAA